jgi:hypothetical protein
MGVVPCTRGAAFHLPRWRAPKGGLPLFHYWREIPLTVPRVSRNAIACANLRARLSRKLRFALDVA